MSRLSKVEREAYRIDRGEFAGKHWIDECSEQLVNTSLSFSDLNKARMEVGDLPRDEVDYLRNFYAPSR